MNCFFFGSSERSLFGVYQPPKGRVAREEGIVLCYPMGQEYMRSHRAFRQLSNLLSRAGYHVLRFDYYATGDSMGESEEASALQWQQDIGTAIEELKDNAGIEKVSLVGLRLGAAMAVQAGAGRPDVGDVVLWDPIISGERYLENLLEAAAAGEAEGFGAASADAGTRKNGETVGVLGFPVTPLLHDEFKELDIKSPGEVVASKLAIFVSSDLEEYRQLQRGWADHGISCDFHCIPCAGNWNEVDNFGSALVPQEIIQGIVSRFVSEKP